jgi:hypothetical protein
LPLPASLPDMTLRVASHWGGFWLAVLTTSALGCATNFTGNAKFPGGARGCYDRCREGGMEMATFVYVGQYSTACACKPRSPSAALSPELEQGEVEAAAVAAGAGVEMQRRRAAASAAAATP